MPWVHLVKAYVKATMGRLNGGKGCMTPSAKLGSTPCEMESWKWVEVPTKKKSKFKSTIRLQDGA